MPTVDYSAGMSKLYPGDSFCPYEKCEYERSPMAFEMVRSMLSKHTSDTLASRGGWRIGNVPTARGAMPSGVHVVADEPLT